MNKNIAIAIIVVVVIALVWALSAYDTEKNKVPGEVVVPDEVLEEIDNTEGVVVDEEVEVVPEPTRYELLKDLPLTEPTKEEPLGMGKEGTFRYYMIEVADSRFSPEVLVAERGNRGQITFVGGEEDVSIRSESLSFSLDIPAGEEAVLGIGLDVLGLFEYKTDDGMVGEIVVVE